MQKRSINMNGCNTYGLWSILLLSVCVWWTKVQSQPANTEEGKMVRYNLNIGDPNKSYEDYREMIAKLRDRLTTPRNYTQGILMLRKLGTVPDDERFILLDISIEGKSNVTFAIDVTNVYIVGYLIGNTRYFSEDAPANAERILFKNAANKRTLPWPLNYVDLETAAGARREKIPLGLINLHNAIETLAKEDKREDPKSLIVVIQMVAEAVRFLDIEWHTLRQQLTSYRDDEHRYLEGRMLDLENSWGALSGQIQNSEGLAFQRPIRIGGQDVDNAHSAVIRGMFLMLFMCAQTTPSREGRQMQSVYPETWIMSIDGRRRLQMACNHLADPRSQIVGRDGLCVDVEGFVYRDKNPVILNTCQRSDMRNQLWNFQSDGRIVSMQKCLAASGHTPGSTAMIHECDTLDESAVQWEMSEYGTLFNKYSQLVLTANSGTPKELTLESQTSSSFQAWQSTNITDAVDVYIRGENNQCIYYNNKKGVYTQECDKGSKWQKWRLYPDSTIRPTQWLDGCLELYSLDNPSANYNYIEADYCYLYPEYHRWIFTREGSIMNLKSSLVVDADKDYPGEGWLKAAPFQGGLNQIWMLQFT
uniref:Uncharacterized protein n=1 Tax=Avena sativa TaxID=4498 RepID=A0ACD5WLX9_AVESA